MDPADVPDNFFTRTSKLDPDSDLYRLVVGGCSVVFLLVALALLAYIAPRRYRQLNQRTKWAAMAHLTMAVCSSLLSLVAASLRLLSYQWLYAILATFLAVSQAVDGMYTWERYRLSHLDYKPSWVARGAVYLYIFV